MCGEKYKIKKRYPLEMGSPPHVRGKEYLGGGRYHVNRITPACAGKSDLYALLSLFKKGSPPRMRGKD